MQFNNSYQSSACDSVSFSEDTFEWSGKGGGFMNFEDPSPLPARKKRRHEKEEVVPVSPPNLAALKLAPPPSATESPFELYLNTLDECSRSIARRIADDVERTPGTFTVQGTTSDGKCLVPIPAQFVTNCKPEPGLICESWSFDPTASSMVKIQIEAGTTVSSDLCLPTWEEKRRTPKQEIEHVERRMHDVLSSMKCDSNNISTQCFGHIVSSEMQKRPLADRLQLAKAISNLLDQSGEEKNVVGMES